MRAPRTLVGQYVAFLAVVVAGLSFAAFDRTTHVMRRGLEDLFRQRFDQATRVLEEHALHRDLTRMTELQSVLGSPRFLAALETGDPATVSETVPSHPLLETMDVVRVVAADGRVLHVTPNLPDALARGLPAAAGDAPASDRWHVSAGGSIYEFLSVDVWANNGALLGRIEIGENLGDTFAEELRRLTGLEVALVLDGQVVDRTTGGVLERANPDQLAGLATLPGGDVVHHGLGGFDTLALRQADPNTDFTVVFLGSVDEAIAPIMGGVRRSMLVLSLVGGLLAMTVMAIFTSRRVGRQVRRLVEHAERIARGDLDFEIRSGSQDELGFLAGELEKMRGELLRGRHEVEAAHAARLNGERMAVVGQMATGIVHDLKNPMAVVQGTADLIQARDPDNAKLTKQCDVIHRQVDRMVSLTRDVLEYARGDSVLDPEVVDLAAWLENVRTLHEESFSRGGVKLSVEPGDPVRVLLDPSRMQRVIDNLLTNAREVSRMGDVVTVSWWRDDAGVHVQVSDTGSGIPEDVARTLFDPFVTSGKQGGSGLGLAIARKIVEDHGARIEVRGASGKGTHFTVTLPLKLISEGEPAREEGVRT